MIAIDEVVLKSGGHSSPEDGMCMMEAVAYFAGEKFSDHPACVCRTLGTFLRNWNDSVNDATRQKLKPYILRVVETASDGNGERRAWMCFDWLTRECAPAFMELAKLDADAKALRDLPEITSMDVLKRCEPKIFSAQKSSDAAAAAARAAAREKLAPVVARLQESALLLLDKMVSLPKASMSNEAPSGEATAPKEAE